MTVVAMSHGELSRYDTLLRVIRRELRVQDAASLLDLTRRQVGRLLIRVRTDGAEGVVSRKHGRPNNRRHSDAFREQVLSLVREHTRILVQLWRPSIWRSGTALSFLTRRYAS